MDDMTDDNIQFLELIQKTQKRSDDLQIALKFLVVADLPGPIELDSLRLMFIENISMLHLQSHMIQQLVEMQLQQGEMMDKLLAKIHGMNNGQEQDH